jgi:hypothetical protein
MILSGVDAFGGNSEYLLAVGELSGFPIANGGLGSVGEVIRLACRIGLPCSGDVDSLEFGLVVLDSFCNPSTAFARRASSEDDWDAAGKLLMMTKGRAGMSTSSFGREEPRVGRSMSFLGGPTSSAEDGGVGSNNTLFWT